MDFSYIRILFGDNAIGLSFCFLPKRLQKKDMLHEDYFSSLNKEQPSHKRL